MQDARALKNAKNLSSWRAWQEQAYGRSGFLAIVAAVCPLTIAFVLACASYGRAPGGVGIPVVLAAGGVFLATALGLMIVALVRLNAWQRAHPWMPPS